MEVRLTVEESVINEGVETWGDSFKKGRELIAKDHNKSRHDINIMAELMENGVKESMLVMRYHEKIREYREKGLTKEVLGSVYPSDLAEILELDYCYTGKGFGTLKIRDNMANISKILAFYGWEVYNDCINHKLKLLRKDGSIESLDKLQSIELRNMIQEDFVWDINRDNLWDLIKAIAAKNEFNPVAEWMEEAKKELEDVFDEDRDYIREHLERTLVLADDSIKDNVIEVIKKWMLQSVYLLHNDDMLYKPEFILVLSGPQGIGKTTFGRNLIPLKFQLPNYSYYKEGTVFDLNKPDSVRIGCSGWIAELGEVESTIRTSSLDKLKAFITNSSDESRLPYAEFAKEFPRRTSFFATTNQEQLLKDPTGARRFFIVYLKNINKITPTDEELKLMWLQVYYQFLEGRDKYDYRLDQAQVNLQNEINDSSFNDNYGVTEFVKEHIVIKEGYGTTLSGLFEYYKIFAKKGGFKALNRTQFGKTLEQRFGYVNERKKLVNSLDKGKKKDGKFEKKLNNYYVGVKMVNIPKVTIK